jgi:transposase-like protein
MAGQARYTDEFKARAYAILETNEGNLKRSARDLGIPVNTLRRWRDEEWNTNKNLPAAEDLLNATGDFLKDAERVRDLSLTVIEAKLQRGEGTLAQVATVLGVLDDKIARAKGLADRVTEHKILLPSRDEIVSALGALRQGAIEAAVTREEEVQDAEVVEQKALPSA